MKGILCYKTFDNASELCTFVNSHNVSVEQIALREQYGYFVLFYRENEQENK